MPEDAITVSVAVNILGGIAIQTIVLVAMDIAMEEKVPLTYRRQPHIGCGGVLVVAVLRARAVARLRGA